MGVITAANTVFVQLSRFNYEQLMGAPHNIIRHPAMPGGAFKLMWDTLQAGDPFCAYVANLAADGSTYSVLATITPLGQDSYLSVRCRPQCDDLHNAATAIYRATRPLELESRAAGLSARDAAATGLQKLAHLLGDAGFATYEDFMNVVLPAEMAIRWAAPQPRRPDATGPAADLLVATTALQDALHDWMAHQSRLADVAQHLQVAVPQLRLSMDEALQTGQTLTRSTSEVFNPVMIWINLWAQMMDSLDNILSQLGQSLTALRQSCLRTVFHLSLTTLHTQTVAQFAVELIDQVTVPGYDEQARMAAINALGQALAHGFSATEERVAANATLAAQTASHVDFTHDVMDIPHQVIAQWKKVADAHASDTAALLPRVEEQVRRTDESLALLEELSRQISSVAQQTPTARVTAALSQVLTCMSALLGQGSPSWAGWAPSGS
ncbi:MAG: hypothetical protein FWD75_10435 [Propionibacteriaceae bacterium]|nr:hypothetical protein [Propionibacteriaceae bacterium]